MDAMLKDIGVSVSFPLSAPICKTPVDPFLGGRESILEESLGNPLDHVERQNLRGQMGHLYLGPQSKSRYVSPDFFARIGQEARLLCRFSNNPCLLFAGQRNQPFASAATAVHSRSRALLSA
jgi:hypothetical protein